MTRLKGVPVFVFNEHNEAYYFWQKARLDGYLRRPLDLCHIDAHDDMGRPTQFRRSIYFNGAETQTTLDYHRRFAREELTISSFILPAVLSGLVKNVYFVYPRWRKFTSSRKRMSICSAFGEGRVVKYAIRPDASAHPMVRVAYPDLKRFSYFAVEATRLPKDRRVILDIDLDYFACRDSIGNELSYELEITARQFRDAKAFLGNRTLPFSGLRFDFAERDGRYFARIERTKVRDVSHLPPKDEIEREIESLVSALEEKRIRPAVVTICRSCDSGYCPEEYTRFIEPRLTGRLEALIGKAS